MAFVAPQMLLCKHQGSAELSTLIIALVFPILVFYKPFEWVRFFDPERELIRQGGAPDDAAIDPLAYFINGDEGELRSGSVQVVLPV